jgi:1-acyl-sn-glycerol-3-phosphate acyltransferase
VAPVAHPNSPTAGSDAADFALAHAGSPDGRGPGLALTPDPATPLATAPAASTLGEALRGVARAASSVLGLGSRSPQVDGWGKDAILSDALRPLADLVYERYWRVRTSGLEHLPSGPCVLVANHSGALPLDGPLLHRVVRRERPQLPDARWLLEDQLFYAPLLGALANRLGAVRATPENAHRLLDEGRPLIVFPEGIPGLSKPFSERHHLARFGRGGYLKVALRAGVPVIPVAMIGGEESTPLLARLPGGVLGFEYLPLTLPPLPSRWKVRFGAQVLLGGAPPDAEGDPGFFEAKNLEVRDALQGLLDALVAEG